MEASEISKYVKSQLNLHYEILKLVREYVDKLLLDVFALDPDKLRREDPSTYFAIIMELARSIFVNYSVESRQKQRTKG
jgi:hypothetical protein